MGGWGGFIELPDLNKPVVCAVNGMCVGGGLEMMIGADIVIAAEHATFSLPEVSIGMIPNLGIVTLMRRLPRQVALEMLLTGRVMDASEAKSWGMVREVVPAADLRDRALAAARHLAAAAPLAVAAIKVIARRTEHLREHEALQVAQRCDSARLCNSPADATEGLRAFAERRQPSWTGT